jgi:NADH:ubiquinone oxidoreductase subunit 6 (subunit J)
MNSIAFIVITILMLTAALAAATLRKLMHAALSFAVAFVGIAALFFLLGAEFVGLVLVFVYIGAVAVLIVFPILLTRRDVGKDRSDLVDPKDAIASRYRPAHSSTHCQTDR